ncbi:hypothetical protein [Stutzerimonas nitrititolerans]|uniref:hypothetical protein n=1 Tax=Stutzerimonas nitrititolerans TaxID=2482751 RepID=UPI00289DA04B|nr:hypothetical protein [Stutzerimonas nitrititolerans]
MDKIGISVDQARQNIQASQAGIEEARAKLTREIDIASKGLLKTHRIPVNKLQISAAQAGQLVSELQELGFSVELSELDPFYTFIVTWA